MIVVLYLQVACVWRETAVYTTIQLVQARACTHLAFDFSIQQNVPCSQVSVDKPLVREVLHAISNLSTEPKQVMWQLCTLCACKEKQWRQLVRGLKCPTHDFMQTLEAIIQFKHSNQTANTKLSSKEGKMSNE